MTLQKGARCADIAKDHGCSALQAANVGARIVERRQACQPHRFIGSINAARGTSFAARRARRLAVTNTGRAEVIVIAFLLPKAQAQDEIELEAFAKANARTTSGKEARGALLRLEGTDHLGRHALLRRFASLAVQVLVFLGRDARRRDAGPEVFAAKLLGGRGTGIPGGGRRRRCTAVLAV